jgi:hypothetical protein
MKQTTIRQILAALLLAGLALGACADPDRGGAASGGGPATTAPATAPTAAVPPTTGPAVPEGGAPVTATGTVREGVEAGCRLLAADGGPAYLLVGGDRVALRPGARVEVEGRLAPGLVSTCQQGKPLRVTAVRPMG